MLLLVFNSCSELIFQDGEEELDSITSSQEVGELSCKFLPLLASHKNLSLILGNGLKVVGSEKSAKILVESIGDEATFMVVDTGGEHRSVISSFLGASVRLALFLCGGPGLQELSSSPVAQLLRDLLREWRKLMWTDPRMLFQLTPWNPISPHHLDALFRHRQLQNLQRHCVFVFDGEGHVICRNKNMLNVTEDWELSMMARVKRRGRLVVHAKVGRSRLPCLVEFVTLGKKDLNEMKLCFVVPLLNVMPLYAAVSRVLRCTGRISAAIEAGKLNRDRDASIELLKTFLTECESLNRVFGKTLLPVEKISLAVRRLLTKNDESELLLIAQNISPDLRCLHRKLCRCPEETASPKNSLQMIPDHALAYLQDCFLCKSPSSLCLQSSCLVSCSKVANSLVASDQRRVNLDMIGWFHVNVDKAKLSSAQVPDLTQSIRAWWSDADFSEDLASYREEEIIVGKILGSRYLSIGDCVVKIFCWTENAEGTLLSLDAASKKTLLRVMRERNFTSPTLHDDIDGSKNTTKDFRSKLGLNTAVFHHQLSCIYLQKRTSE